MVGPHTPPPLYPMGQPASGTDTRFTFGLVLDVAEVLAKRRYPDIVAAASGIDTVELRQVLYGFLYGPTGAADKHTAGCPVWRSPLCDCRGDR